MKSFLEEVNIYEEDSIIWNFRIVQTEGSRQVTCDTKHYNLQMIIAVGFKVNIDLFMMADEKYYEGEDISVIEAFMKERCWKTIES